MMPEEAQEEGLRSKTAVVTGSGRGIGRAIALAYAHKGADLCLVARTLAQLESVAGEIRRLQRRVLVVKADVTNWDEVQEISAQVRTAFGGIDVLVNNAGGGKELGSVLESRPSLWIRDVESNLIGAYLVTRAFLPLMIESGGGRIINIGSGTGHRPGPGGSAYKASKAGLWAFTQILAQEVWEFGIDVNELVPGPVETDLTRDHMQVGAPPPYAPSERVKVPEDVAPLAVWLATQPPGGPTAQSYSLARRPV